MNQKVNDTKYSYSMQASRKSSIVSDNKTFRDSRKFQRQYLEKVLLRATEEKLLQYIEKEFYQKQRLDLKQVQQQRLQKIKQFYRNSKTNDQSDEVTLEDEEQNQIIRKIYEFQKGDNPVQYFKRIQDENGNQQLIPTIDVSKRNEKFKILATKLFDKKQLLDEIHDNHADKYMIDPLKYKDQLNQFKQFEPFDKNKMKKYSVTQPNEEENENEILLKQLKTQNVYFGSSNENSPTKIRGKQNSILREKQKNYFVSNNFGKSQILDDQSIFNSTSKQQTQYHKHKQSISFDKSQESETEPPNRKRNISIMLNNPHQRRGAAHQNIFQIHLDAHDENLRKLFQSIASREINGQIQMTQRDLFKYLQMRYKKQSVEKIITFLSPHFDLEFRNYRIFVENFNQWQHNDILFFCFFILDIDNDGLLNQNDIFFWLFQSELKMVEQDMKAILNYLEDRSGNFRINIEEFQNVKPENFEFYLENEPKTHKLYVKKTRKYESKMDQSIKKDSIYHRTLFQLEHDSMTRQFKIQGEQKKGGQVKDQIKRALDQNKSKYTEMMEIVQRDKRNFAINFGHFKTIFNYEKPQFFYDLICFLTLFKQRGINYPYEPQIFINYNKNLKKQQNLLQVQNKKHPLEDIFPFSYKEKSPFTYKMVDLVQKYKGQGERTLQTFIDNLANNK